MSGLEQLLENLLVPDTAVIQDATKQLKELYKDPKIILEFCTLLQHSQNAQVRQYASILLRKKLQKYWNQVTPEDKQAIKSTLLQALLSEQIHFVRASIAQLIGEIGKTEIPANQWPEILQLLQVLRDASTNAVALLGQQGRNSIEAEEAVVSSTFLTVLSRTRQRPNR